MSFAQILDLALVLLGTGGLLALGVFLLRLIGDRAYVTWARELGALLFQPAGWIILLLLYWFRSFEIRGLLQRAQMIPVDREQFSAAYLQTGSSVAMLLLVPGILTMRSLAEEKRTGSLEVLLTAPIRDHEVVLGKFYAALCYFAVLWLPAMLLLVVLGGPAYLDLPPLEPGGSGGFALGPLLTGYLGILTIGALFLAFGVFASSLTDNQLLAALLSMLFSFAMLYGPSYTEPLLRELQLADAPGFGTVAGQVGEQLMQGAFSGLGRLAAALRDDVLLPFVQRANIAEHLGLWYFRGLLNTAHMVFYAVGVLCFLMLALRSLEMRRWR
jgi:ABC-type transport system involved in multi-copper enzyme maturation permease subunit